MTDSDSRQRQVIESRDDRARSLASVHEVARRAGAAGPTRPHEWRDDLLASLDELAASLYEQYARSAHGGSPQPDRVRGAAPGGGCA